MNWKLEAAKLQFGLQYEEKLPDLACSALAEGFDSPSLRILAGSDGKDHFEVRMYLEKAVRFSRSNQFSNLMDYLCFQTEIIS